MCHKSYARFSRRMNTTLYLMATSRSNIRGNRGEIAHHSGVPAPGTRSPGQAQITSVVMYEHSSHTGTAEGAASTDGLSSPLGQTAWGGCRCVHQL